MPCSSIVKEGRESPDVVVCGPVLRVDGSLKVLSCAPLVALIRIMWYRLRETTEYYAKRLVVVCWGGVTSIGPMETLQGHIVRGDAPISSPLGISGGITPI